MTWLSTVSTNTLAVLSAFAALRLQFGPGPRAALRAADARLPCDGARFLVWCRDNGLA